ncbi:A disintegrin and metalloproteinase with thrombospondin motifs 16 [Plakobranchus ocellatus]|uniref:A disintegrin and metalloproteinase with thrombospondin motifs 16 n=1 Tax=Plakobranchus ocellatus TaxID=259542 RepID=A0AAV3ZL12_9GAST|nr:A disintegrin and metalloproteinase with thrombospondin motifs 16 [Plakobranchus ocellatus]
MGLGGTVVSESALRSPGTLLSRVRTPLLAPWPDAALPDRECLRRNDFQSDTLSNVTSLVGQVFTLDEQCAGFINRSVVCRENVTNAANGSWDSICSNNLCLFPDSSKPCFEMTPLQFTSCGNKRWCVDGVCVDDADAPEKPVDCPAGDSSALTCDLKLCRSGRYDEVTRFVNCCYTCQPIKTERFVTVSEMNLLNQTKTFGKET